MHPSVPTDPDCSDWVVTLLRRGHALRRELRAAGAATDLVASRWRPAPDPHLDAGSQTRLAALIEAARTRRQGS